MTQPNASSLVIPREVKARVVIVAYPSPPCRAGSPLHDQNAIRSRASCPRTASPVSILAGPLRPSFPCADLVNKRPRRGLHDPIHGGADGDRTISTSEGGHGVLCHGRGRYR